MWNDISSNKLMLAVVGICLTLSSGSLRAENFSWSGECTPNVDWNRKCPVKTNWVKGAGGPGDDEALPGPLDNVLIEETDPETRLAQNFAVESINAKKKVLIDGGYTLTLLEGGGLRDLALTNGSLATFTDQTVSLTGDFQFGGMLLGDGTGGLFTVLNQWTGGGWIGSGAQVRNQGTADINSKLRIGGDGSRLINEGTLNIKAKLEGASGWVENLNELNVSGGVQREFDSNFIHGGTLNINDVDTEFWLKSQVLQFNGGSVNIQEGASLLLRALNGTPSLQEILLPTTFEGGGWAVIDTKDIDVKAAFTNRLGSGPPIGGTGGVRLETILSIRDSVKVTNDTGARWHFDSGLLNGNGTFLNKGEAFTQGSGGAHFEVNVTNEGIFSILCCTLYLAGDAQFHNRSILVVEGNMSIDAQAALRNGNIFGDIGSIEIRKNGVRISGEGYLSNQINSEIIVDISGGGNVFITTTFYNGGTETELGNGKVIVKEGSLILAGSNLVNLDEGGVLRGGAWISSSKGHIDFPRQIKEFSGRTAVDLGAPSAEFSQLQLISSESQAVFRGGQDFSGPVQVNGLLKGSQITINGKATIEQQGKLIVDPQAPVEATGGVDLGSDVDPGLPDLESTPPIGLNLNSQGSLLGDEPLPNSRLVTPVLNNRGRVLPGGRGEIAVLEVEGNYQQFAKGRLQVEASGAALVDTLHVIGNASLDGWLELGRIPGAPPVSGQTYTILTTTGSLSGKFSEVESVDDVEVIYNVDSVQVRFLAVDEGYLFDDGFE